MNLKTLALLFINTSFLFALELEGKWVTGCVKEDTAYGVEAIQIEENHIRYLVKAYSDQNCTSYTMDVYTEATFEIGAALQSVENAYEADLIFEKVFATPKSSFATFLLNSKRTCGFSNWKVGEPKEISGRKCEGKQIPARGAEGFDIISRQNTKFLYGLKTKSLDGSSIEKRPVILDKNKVFVGP